MGASCLLLWIIPGEEAGERPEGYRTTNKDWKKEEQEQISGPPAWITQCGGRGVVSVVSLSDTDQRQDQLRLTLRKKQSERPYLCILGDINHSEAEKLPDPPRAPVHTVYMRLHSAPSPPFCMCLKLSSEAGNSVFPLMLQCLFHSPSHPRVLAAWLLFPPPPPPPPSPPHPTSAQYPPASCLSKGRQQQVFCDSKIREPRRDGAPLSSAACVGGGEKNPRFHFQSLSSLSLQQERERERERLSRPRMTRAQVQCSSERVLSMLHARVWLQLSARSCFVSLRNMRATRC